MCPLVADPEQLDADDDGQGDACEDDVDGDTVLDDVDNCPMVPNLDQRDADGDSFGDACDNDDEDDEPSKECSCAHSGGAPWGWLSYLGLAAGLGLSRRRVHR